MKKILAVLICAFAFISIGCARTDVQDVFRFEAREVSLEVGEVASLKMVMGGITDTQKIVITTDQKDIVSIRGSSSTFTLNDTICGKDDTIEIKGLNPGVVNLSAYVKDNRNVNNSIKVTVSNTKLSYMEITGPSVLEINQSAKLTVDVLPVGVSNEVIWSSSNTDSVKVDQDGTVTAYRGGVVVISATSKYDSTFVGKKQINVEYAKATQVSVTAPKTNLKIGEEVQLSYAVLPALADQSVTFSVSDSKIISVETKGTVLAVSSGSAIVTVTSADGRAKGTITINVSYEDPTAVTIEKPKTTEMIVGESVKLKATVEPANANSVVTWSSSDVEVATVKADGTVTTVGPGNVTITATGAGGKVSASVDFVVSGRPDPTEIEFYFENKKVSEIEIEYGSDEKLKVNVLPAGALQDLTFEIENEEIVRSVIYNANTKTVTIATNEIEGTTTVTFTSVADPNIKFVLTVKCIPWLD